MITLIYGGSASGKSAFAEQTVMDLLPEGPKYYIATMQVYGEEGKRRVKRHVQLRAGKGFQTIECPVDLTSCLPRLKDAREAAILLECVSNLAANEMFDSRQSPDDAPKDPETVTRKITDEIQTVCSQVKHAVIVTNNIFEDGTTYAKETAAYMQCLGAVNRYLAQLADNVIEVIAGMPVTLKPSQPQPVSEQRQKGISPQMRLIIGGTAQGKKEYVIRQLENQGQGFCVVDENSQELTQIPQETQVLILDHLHLLIRKFGEEAASTFLSQTIEQCNASDRELIIICDEVGNGVVPLSKEERDYREHVGRIICSLAQEASTVERVICGIAQRLL